MKRRTSTSSQSSKTASCENKIKVSKNEMQTLIQQEVHSAMKQTETKLDCLLEKIQKMETEINYESAIHKLEAHIKKVKRRGDAALAYVMKMGMNVNQDNTQKKGPLLSPVVSEKLAISRYAESGSEKLVLRERSGTEDEIMKIVSLVSNKSMEDNAELLQTMETTKKALEKMREDSEALKTAIEDLSNEAPPPVLSPISPPHKMLRLIKEEPVCSQVDKPKEVKKEMEVEEPNTPLMKVEQLFDENNTSPKYSETEKEELSYPPLPATPFPSVLSMKAASYNIPQRLSIQLALIRNPPGLSVLWNIEEEDPSAPPMESYSVYMTVEKVKGSSVFPEWKTLGEVAAIPLPMCVMISNYKPGYKACFAVVGKDKFGRYGPYSKVVPANIPE